MTPHEIIERIRASQVAREKAERERRRYIKPRHVPLAGDGDEVLDYLCIPEDTHSTSFQMLPEDYFVRCWRDDHEPHGIILLGKAEAIMRGPDDSELPRCMAALDWVPYRGTWACQRRKEDEHAERKDGHAEG